MDDTVAFATVRQLAKMHYWTTRALNAGHPQSVRRARLTFEEFAQDVDLSVAKRGVWWSRICNELNDLNADLDVSKMMN